MTEIYNGIIEDPRTAEEKSKDWTTDELLTSSSAFTWKEKKKWKKYTVRDQKGTSSCVPQSISKALEVNEKKESGKNIVFSATKAYAMRTNSGPGSWLQQMLQYACDPAYYTTEEKLKSQKLKSDAEMEEIAKLWNEDMEKIAKKYAGKSYLTITKYNDIDEIAFWISQGFGVPIIIYADTDEWKLKYPEVKREVVSANAQVRHAIAAVDFGLINGERYIKIEDSAHFGGINERWVSADFIKKRCYGAGIIYDKTNQEETEPDFQFTYTLFYGMKENDDVKELQKKLKKLGLFPEAIPSTGNYFEITRQAVEKFQVKYNVADAAELAEVKGKIVGPKTRKVLNSLQI